MFPRLIFPVVLAFISLNLLAQARIVSVTYDGDVATLSRNTPPAGIIYYWQGTSCGTLMNHSSATTLATTDGSYFLRGYNSSGAVWATTCASTTVTFPDLTPPVLYGVTTGPIDEGDPIAATSNENGMIYLVLEGTAANLTAINNDKVGEATATAHTQVSLSTTGIGLGLYKVFAVDVSDNISVASDYIEVADLTAPVLSDVTAGPIEAGTDILATSNEDGVIYLVPDGTAPGIGDITTAQVSQTISSANVASTLATTGIDVGDYIVYAVDASDNISAASSTITVNPVTFIDLNTANSGRVQLYPVSVVDILYIKSREQVSSATVYSLQGAQMIKISTALDQIDMSSLSAGVYIVNLKLEDGTGFSARINKD